jgi:hypothetical protein
MERWVGIGVIADTLINMGLCMAGKNTCCSESVNVSYLPVTRSCSLNSVDSTKDDKSHGDATK